MAQPRNVNHLGTRDFDRTNHGVWLILWSILLSLTDLAFAYKAKNLVIEPSQINDHIQIKSVLQVHQDRRGFLWILTQEAVHQFSGHTIRSFYPDKGLPGKMQTRIFSEITEDREGNIWLAMVGGGLSFYDPVLRQFVEPSNQNGSGPWRAESDVSALLPDDSGTIWIGTVGGQIYALKKSSGRYSIIHESSQPEPLAGPIIGFTEYAENQIIAVNRDGVFSKCDLLERECRKNHISNLLRVSHQPLNANVLFSDEARNIWIGTSDNGVYELTEEGVLKRHYRHDPKNKSSISNDSIKDIFQDGSGLIWIATDIGLNLLDRGRFIRFTRSNSDLTTNRILGLSQDSFGNFWIATFFGLHIARAPIFQVYNQSTGLLSDAVTVFAEQSPDQIWIGSYEGLSRLDFKTDGESQRLQVFVPEANLADPRIMCAVYREPYVWVGYREHGFQKFDLFTGDSQIFNRNSVRGMESNSVSQIISVGSDLLAVSTFGAGMILVKDNGEVTDVFRQSPSENSGLSSDYIITMEKTDDSNLLIGTPKGLNSLDLESRRIESLNSTDNNQFMATTVIYAIHTDQNKNVWLGTKGQGLVLWNSSDRHRGLSHFERVITNPPLPSSLVYAIEEDDNGIIWIATGNGLVRMHPDTRQIRIFDVSDGLQDNEFNTGVSFKDSTGHLYFGGNRGFNRFKPEDIVDDTEPPPVRLVDIEIAGEPLPYDVSYIDIPELVLTHEDYMVDFHFSVLDFVNPARTHYKYKLENFDNDWIDIGNRHNAAFTSLPSGQYTLRVIGANSDGVWNTEGISLPIRVLPAPWFTWWAFTIYGALAMALLLFVKKFYDTHLLKQQATQYANTMHNTAERAMDDLQDQLHMEQNLVKNIHEHAENTLNIIAGFLARQADSIDDEAILETFEENQQRFRCLQLLDDNVFYSLDKLEVNFHQFLEALYREYVPAANRQDLEIVAVNDSLDIRIPAEIAIPAALITNELVTNSLKHAYGEKTGIQTLSVFLRESGDYRHWVLEVSDSGVGLPKSINPAIPTTTGMEVVRGFVQQLNASMIVERERGTKFRFEIPKPQPTHSAL